MDEDWRIGRMGSFNIKDILIVGIVILFMLVIFTLIYITQEPIWSLGFILIPIMIMAYVAYDNTENNFQ